MDTDINDLDGELVVAASKGQLDVLTVVLEAGADINAVDDRGGGPLHWWASGPSNTETAELLIKAGCNPMRITTKGRCPCMTQSRTS